MEDSAVEQKGSFDGGNCSPRYLSLWEKLANRFGELLFLEYCRICRGYCLPDRQGDSDRKETKAVCADCWGALAAGEPSLDWCPLDRQSAFKIASGARYRGQLKKLVYHLKYDGDRLVAHDLALLLVAAWTRLACDFAHLPIVLVPVPLHRERLRARGYNQAQLVAASAAKKLRLTADPSALKRVKPTVAQHGLGRAERLVNLSGAFACQAGRIEGKAVLLVDDIFTSGATLAEAARTVIAGGAQAVAGLTVARAVLATADDAGDI